MTPSRLLLGIYLLIGSSTAFAADAPIDIGDRRELFVDDYLIEKTTGDVTHHLHKPEPKEVVLTTNAPWEGNTSAYFTIFQDGDRYRMYYRGLHHEGKTQKHPAVVCYAESRDGIHWERPNLGLYAFNGSKRNNIILDDFGTHNFVAFKDTNPDCPPGARYKAIAQGEHGVGKGLHVFQSPDGIRWKPISKKPVITKGAFDSQNLAFWDPVAMVYREYHRDYDRSVKPPRRTIVMCTSKDYVTWTDPVPLEYPGSPKQELYTNAVQPYERAPHILIGFPARYLAKQGHGVEPLFMASRDGVTFTRYNDPVIPRTAPQDRDGNRSNYMAWGIVDLPGRPNHLSVYATEGYYQGADSRLRRFEYHKDGFVSLRGGSDGGELVTKPFVFTGKRLSLNLAASAAGLVRVEIQDVDGEPMPGFALSQCTPLKGDDIDRTVEWESGPDVSQLAGKPIRLRILINNTDVYSFTFGD
jgi:hypothetical protein